ncbi:F0F1 ATP synthase subunit epsilon [Solidesulfovibrio sp.]|uniref:F0F1 ATP synthase subunit epsilon n=1 Tax=Solidesulfovibrio sp. TaxID=2910990 RepID=UPI002639DDB0|nr:F0F1 ATP synthase subunit epsilon [Solidesulfovibrio sp.]
MAKTLAVEIVTPDRLVLGQEADSVTMSGVAGEFTVLPLHIPFLSALAIGTVVIRRAGAAKSVFVSGGFADVTADRVLILAEAAELPEEIDAERARKARERAEARLAVQHREDVDFTRAKAALQRALLRLKLHGSSGKGLGGVSAGLAR